MAKKFIKIYSKICLICKKDFKSKVHNKKRCDECLEILKNKTIEERKCVICKKKFKPIKYNNIYCSYNCRKKSIKSSVREKNRKLKNYLLRNEINLFLISKPFGQIKDGVNKNG